MAAQTPRNRESVAMLAEHMRLCRTEGVGCVTYRRLLRRYRSPQAALEAFVFEKRKTGRNIIPPDIETIHKEIERVYAMGGLILSLDDVAYPRLLTYIPDAPPIIYILGSIECFRKRSVAIVGARNASAIGMRMAETLATDLGQNGIAVVSGLARGIDRAAHLGGLVPGPTIAAVAGGLDRPYPPEHAGLQQKIIEHGGAIITESPLGTVAQARHFPKRNRLIVALSLGCVVIEAAPRSGSLITARMALDYGRTLFAVPGSPLDPRSLGSNDLIRQGAILTENARDILSELPHEIGQADVKEKKSDLFTHDSAPEPDEISAEDEEFSLENQGFSAASLPLAERIIQLLTHHPASMDDIIRHCQFSAPAVLVALTELELCGRIAHMQGGYVLAAPSTSDVTLPPE